MNIEGKNIKKTFQHFKVDIIKISTEQGKNSMNHLYDILSSQISTTYGLFLFSIEFQETISVHDGIAFLGRLTVTSDDKLQ